MAQQSASANGVAIELWSVVDEINDDDEDVLEVTIDVRNESGQDMWDVKGDIRDMDGTNALARTKPSRVESGDSGELVFWIPCNSAAWLFKMTYSTDSASGNLELGPFTNDLRIEAKPKPERSNQTEIRMKPSTEATSGDPLAAAFGVAMDGFGEMKDDENVLSVDLSSDNPMQAAFAGGLLESQQNVPEKSSISSPPSAPSVAPQTAPPVSPPATPSIAPQTAPPASAFAATPPGPPSGPPAGPPSGPPTGPPSGPPTGPPSGPPTGPPSGPPTGPPSGPPKSAGPPGPPPS